MDVVRIKSHVLKKIKKEFYKAGIDIPFPTQVVLWHDQTEDVDGDRSKQREGWAPGAQPPRANTLAKAIVSSKKD